MEAIGRNIEAMAGGDVMTAVRHAPALDGRLAGPGREARRAGWRPACGRDDMFAADVFADLTLPHWRVQASGADAAFRLREDSHPHPAARSGRGARPHVDAAS